MLPEAGATELIFLAAVALIVVGPKDLPVLMRKVGRWVAKMRGLAAEFRSSFDELARQSELDELRKEVEALRSERLPDPLADLQPTLAEVSAGLDPSGFSIGDPHYTPPPPVEFAGPLPEPEPVEFTPPAEPPEYRTTVTARPHRRGAARAALGPAPGVVTPKRKLVAAALSRRPAFRPRPRRVSVGVKA